MPAIKLLILRVGKVELFYLQKWSGDWNRIYCVVTSVCVFRFFTPCYWREIQRLRKCQVILNRIVSPIFGVVLMKILWRTMRMMLKKALTHKLTSRVVSRDVLTARFKCHFWGKNSSTLHALVKLTIFIVGIPNFGIVYFKRYIFILCGKNFRFIDTLSGWKSLKTIQAWTGVETMFNYNDHSCLHCISLHSSSIWSFFIFTCILHHPRVYYELTI